MEEIESICNKYEIRDITEFTHQRVSHKDDLEDGCTRSLSMTGSYQLFNREAYAFSQMNPF